MFFLAINLKYTNISMAAVTRYIEKHKLISMGPQKLAFSSRAYWLFDDFFDSFLDSSKIATLDRFSRLSGEKIIVDPLGKNQSLHKRKLIIIDFTKGRSAANYLKKE